MRRVGPVGDLWNRGLDRCAFTDSLNKTGKLLVPSRTLLRPRLPSATEISGIRKGRYDRSCEGFRMPAP